jgi:hypothetical protein
MNSLKTQTIINEYKIVAEAIKLCDGHIGNAAKLLSIDRKTIYNKIWAYEKYLQSAIIVPDYSARMPKDGRCASMSISSLPIQRGKQSF